MTLPPNHARFDALFRAAAERHGLLWPLLKAQAIAESNLNGFAVSKAGACGLTQFMPKTWAETMGDDASPFAPAHAIEAQGRYLRRLIDLLDTDDLDAVLAAYNWGPSRVKRHLALHDGEVVPSELPAETRRYLATIRALMDELSEPDAISNDHGLE